MAFIQCRFFSEVLKLTTSMTVILPEQTAGQMGTESVSKQERHQTLYLLHGLSDDDSIWTRRTSIERYVSTLGIAVVMPQVHRSFYTNMAYGNQYWTFLHEELPRVARSFFPLSAKREDNFVAGLSMGGYGALKWALRKPTQFAAVASLSGVTDIVNIANVPEVSLDDYDLIFGDEDARNTDNDLFWLIEQVDQMNGPKPKIYQCCGTEDFLYEDNIAFRKACEQTNLDFTYEEEQGTHDWDYWDKKIQDVLAWLPIR
ncbi:alpha/beta hydrolase [Pontibacillus litoralis]|uniref:Esterase n=1 Tax=Pontibacillus litoralis JSM 072002 TaxID=1385512 RepID=A0A0A5G0Z7_9BACI|nr:alpha/beta hydrolase family protein [Pontibacillus litoralis]KGX84783.1 esterase [Pontibacillus litoralis JSM 072002]